MPFWHWSISVFEWQSLYPLFILSLKSSAHILHSQLSCLQSCLVSGADSDRTNTSKESVRAVSWQPLGGRPSASQGTDSGLQRAPKDKTRFRPSWEDPIWSWGPEEVCELWLWESVTAKPCARYGKAAQHTADDGKGCCVLGVME